MNAAIEFDVAARSVTAPEDATPASQLETDRAGDVRGRMRLAAAEAERGRLLRYRADRRSVAWVGFMFAAHALVFFLAPTWLAALLVVPLAVGSMFVAPINHHHQHLNTFHAAWLNRVYELALSLQTGIAPFGWVLHHNLGHHVNYLHQRPHPTPDESRWTRRDGSQMGRVEYTLDLLLHHQLDILRVGRRHPRYLRAFLWMKLPLWALLGLAIWWNPMNAFLAILLPGWITLAHTAWATYEHHAGLYADDHYEASVNIVSPVYNFMTCNLGYHTAHHKRPGVHWSLLPALHAEIEHRIPKEQIQPTFW
ncbi:MAG: fatty acid desaturase [Myxococcota bacterium]